MELIIPNWQVAKNIRAYSSTRLGGVSRGVYQGLNLGTHVADDPCLVEENRHLLAEYAGCPEPMVWLNQTHSTLVADVGGAAFESCPLDADGAITSSPGVVCTVMTADCLPVLLTDIEGSRVAAVHAGWRGLANGILENAVGKFDKPVIAWLGPAIGRRAFEVGRDVYDCFLSHDSEAKKAFVSQGGEKYLADMNLLATQRLQAVGVKNIFCSDMCTFEDPERFYSYRRDGVTGRQATFIWIE